MAVTVTVAMVPVMIIAVLLLMLLVLLGFIFQHVGANSTDQGTANRA